MKSMHAQAKRSGAYLAPALVRMESVDEDAGSEPTFSSAKTELGRR